MARKSRIVILACLMLAPHALAQTSNSAEEEQRHRERVQEMLRKHAPAELKRNANGAFLRPNESYTQIDVPRPISPDDIERWSRVMTLSGAQHELLQRLYAAYQSTELAYHHLHVQPLWEEGAAILDLPRGPERDAASRALRFGTRVETARSQLAAIESSMFDTLAYYLSDEQLEKLDLVRNERRRTCARNNYLLLGADADLTMMIDELGQAKYDITVADPVRFGEVLVEYDARLTAVRDALDSALAKNLPVASETIDTLSSMGGPGRTLDDPDVREVLDEYESVNQTLLDHARAVLQVNDAFVDRFAELLPVRTGRALRENYLALICRDGFPPPLDIRSLVDKLAALRTPSPKQNETLTELADAFDKQWRAMELRIVERYREWREQCRLSFLRASPAAYDREMTDLKRQRLELIEKTLDSIESTLEPAQFEPLAEEIAGAERACARELERLPPGIDAARE